MRRKFANTKSSQNQARSPDNIIFIMSTTTIIIAFLIVIIVIIVIIVVIIVIMIITIIMAIMISMTIGKSLPHRGQSNHGLEGRTPRKQHLHSQ